ncbi:hypothetical protein [Methylocystis rosea]|uniref:hypothetical protein n=1 Tax=Methylocystis rosea TaxID=173366 RepID=UPI00035D9CD7|nr:hypothetical protein [Methylocystis rosea]
MNETQETEAPRNRLQVLGHQRASKKKPLTVLDAKAQLLISYLIHGCQHDYVTQITRAAPTEFDPDARRPLEPGEPMKLEEAADLLRIRRRHARWIMAQPIAQKELALQLQSLRSGMKAQALMTVGEIMTERGENSAADRKVRLAAAQTIMGDEARGPAVNVNVGVGVQLTAGIVVRLPANVPQTPLESGAEPRSIIDTHPLTREQRMLTRVESNEVADD